MNLINNAQAPCRTAAKLSIIIRLEKKHIVLELLTKALECPSSAALTSLSRFSPPKDGKGTGLGLSISRDIVA
jgi:signal transduction histidine kinase